MNRHALCILVDGNLQAHFYDYSPHPTLTAAVEKLSLGSMIGQSSRCSCFPSESAHKYTAAYARVQFGKILFTNWSPRKLCKLITCRSLSHLLLR